MALGEGLEPSNTLSFDLPRCATRKQRAVSTNFTTPEYVTLIQPSS